MAISQQERDAAVYDKRKHVVVTTLCNNNCIFCLAGDKLGGSHRPVEELAREMEDGIREGCTRLILSGGEASIHPDFLTLVAMGREKGYRKIQAISNGRMYSYHDFARRAREAGLDEVTFSVHGVGETHDRITRVRGAYDQVERGIRNTLSLGYIVSVDIVVNRQNYRGFPLIVSRMLSLGVREFDILWPVPFGHAYKNLDMVYFDPHDALPYIIEGIRRAEEAGSVVWTNRFPGELLEGYERLIQDPHKLMDEIEGRKTEFQECVDKGTLPHCRQDDRCRLCNMRLVCEDLWSISAISPRDRARLARQEDLLPKIWIGETIEEESASRLLSAGSGDRIVIEPLPPVEPLSSYSKKSGRMGMVANRIASTARMLLSRGALPEIRNVPPCLLPEWAREHWVPDRLRPSSRFVSPEGRIDVVSFVEAFSEYHKSRPLRCSSCKYSGECRGVYTRYAMAYGFGELRPVGG